MRMERSENGTESLASVDGQSSNFNQDLNVIGDSRNVEEVGSVRCISSSEENLCDGDEQIRKRQRRDLGYVSELNYNGTSDRNAEGLSEPQCDLVDLSGPTQIEGSSESRQNSDEVRNDSRRQLTNAEYDEGMEEHVSLIDQFANSQELVNLETYNGDDENDFTAGSDDEFEENRKEEIYDNDDADDDDADDDADADDEVGAGGEGGSVQVLSEEDQIKAQQVIEIEDDDQPRDSSEMPFEFKRASEYVCPICMEPPEASLMTNCGHIFCTSCLYGMVNSSRGHGRRNGICALCRKDVRLQDIRMIILKKKRIKKSS